MSDTVQRPQRKNPILRTRLPTLPPGTRSRVALGLTAAAALGRFELQVCEQCGAVQYPPREALPGLPLASAAWRTQDGAANSSPTLCCAPPRNYSSANACRGASA